MAVSHRARQRHDREGDPLDGLVNLFDLGIVLAVGFLLAALASAQLDPTELGKRQEPKQEPPIVANENQPVDPIDVKPGQKVVGRGEKLGTVYQLSDGRTVIVREP